jgi:hypothetical protein
MRRFVMVVLIIAAAAAALWLGINAISAFSSGWHVLSARYPAGPNDALSCKAGQTVDVHKTGEGVYYFKRCVCLSVDEKGIGLKLPLPLRFFKPPILIPWRDVTGCTVHRWGRNRFGYEFTVRDAPVIITVPDSFGNMERLCAERNIPMSRP